jgi:hypothetical protein
MVEATRTVAAARERHAPGLLFIVLGDALAPGRLILRKVASCSLPLKE